VQRFGAAAFQRAGDDDRGVAGDRLDLGAARGGFAGEVGFVQHDHGLRAARAGGGEVAFDAAEVEIRVERTDEEYGIDVRGDHLLDIALAGGFAGELRAARQHGVDQRARVVAR
jgi:hypothetical protein